MLQEGERKLHNPFDMLLLYPLFLCVFLAAVPFSHTYEGFNVFTSFRVCVSALDLPVTLPGWLPDPHHQSCSSLPHWPQALTPHFMDHGPHAFFYYCAFVSVDKWWETWRDTCNLIGRHAECRPLFSLKGRTPGALRRHAHTDPHTNTLSQACSNSSQKAPELNRCEALPFTP